MSARYGLVLLAHGVKREVPVEGAIMAYGTQTTDIRSWNVEAWNLRPGHVVVVVTEPPRPETHFQGFEAGGIGAEDLADLADAGLIERRYADAGVAGLRVYGEYRDATRTLAVLTVIGAHSFLCLA